MRFGNEAMTGVFLFSDKTRFTVDFAFETVSLSFLCWRLKKGHLVTREFTKPRRQRQRNVTEQKI